MEQTVVQFPLDANVKRDMEQVCKKWGLTLTSAFTMFAEKVAREHCIPMEMVEDPFYSEENMTFLREAIRDLEAGKGIEHELIEA